jgi:hypothetical protein
MMPSTPKRSVRAGVSCIVDNAGAGDQVMIAEGTSYEGGPGDLSFKFGFSPVHPTVIQSYDPADPFNEARYGRAAAGKRPVLFTSRVDGMSAHHRNADQPYSYFAIRGLDWNPGNVPDQFISWNTNNYLLFENNVFRYTQLAAGGEATVKHIYRKNSFYGSWSATAHAQGIYANGTRGVTVEDNVFWHVGWNVNASREDLPANGGPTIFRHSVYMQTDTSAVARRNVFVDPAATGASMRGDVGIFENVFIDNPISIASGLGDGYNVSRPAGVSIEIASNLFIGDADVNSSNPRGGGIISGNGKPGSYIRKNLFLRSRSSDSANLFSNHALFDQPSYMAYEDNFIYRFSKSYDWPTTYPARVISTYDRNIWDGPTLGTNINNSQVSIKNPITAADIYQFLGCQDKQTCIARMIQSPEQPWAARIRNYTVANYGR